MDNKIIETTERLQEAHGLIAKFVETQSLSFEEKKRLIEIYRSIKDTNGIIEYAERAAHEDIEQLYFDAHNLQQSSQGIMDVFKLSSSIIESFDTQEDCEKYLKPFEDARKKAEEEAQLLWEEFKPLNNRLDMWGFSHGNDDEEEFKALERERDAAKERYDKQHSEVNRLYIIWRQEVSNISGLMYFELTLLQTIAFRINRIAKAIISNIDNLKKKGIV